MRLFEPWILLICSLPLICCVKLSRSLALPASHYPICGMKGLDKGPSIFQASFKGPVELRSNSHLSSTQPSLGFCQFPVWAQAIYQQVHSTLPFFQKDLEPVPQLTSQAAKAACPAGHAACLGFLYPSIFSP